MDPHSRKRTSYVAGDIDDDQCMGLCDPMKTSSAPITPTSDLIRLPEDSPSVTKETHVPDYRKKVVSDSHKKRRVASTVVTCSPVEFRKAVQSFTGVASIGRGDQLLKEKGIHAPLKPVVHQSENVEAEEGEDIGFGDVGSGKNTAKVRRSVDEEFLNVPENLKQLALYGSLFPASYDFEEDTLVQLWMAGGFLHNMKFESLETAGISCFKIFLQKKIIVPSRFDHICGTFKYKISSALGSVLAKAISDGEYSIVEGWILNNISERLQHLSLVSEELKIETFDALERCRNLKTLLLFSHRGCTLEHVPRSLFLRLTSLRSLDLSLTDIFELPDSIGNVISLRYIDLSETPIRWLPESFDKLCNLQTLRLRDCLSLVGLPNGMRELTSMRHLILDNAHQLISMPPGLRNLTDLRTLTAFLVGGDFGCSIKELENLNNLSGKLSILRLENVSNASEAEEVALKNKKNIKKIELHWSNLRDENIAEEEEVLTRLQPNFGLKELNVLHYGGLKFPNWFSDASFADLVSVTFFNCGNCQLLPSIGELPSLKILCLQKMNSITELNSRFCRARQATCAFPKLEVFKISEMQRTETSHA